MTPTLADQRDSQTRGDVTPRRVYGVDFSGAGDAGRKIWIAAGVATKDTLAIERCAPALEWFGTGADRGPCLATLATFIEREGEAVFGMDFPFTLPRRLIKEPTWDAFALGFGERYASVAEFDRDCRIVAGGREWRRDTEQAAGTPFSAYNLRLQSQTYHGIRDVLAPLVQTGAACVLPMQRSVPAKPWLMEVCPASTLKAAGHYKPPYKGPKRSHRDARRRILAWLETEGTTLDSSLRERVASNSSGDALDSVIAAHTVAVVLRRPGLLRPSEGLDPIEGHVYV